MAVIEVPEAKVARILFSDTRSSWLWLILRLYIGWTWLSAGWEKFTDPAWIGPQSGSAIEGFFSGALTKTSGSHPDVAGWYAWFLQNVAIQHPNLLSYLVTYGEIFVGIAIILGAFTAIAAFFGAFMNMNYLLAGTVSINPILLVGEFFLILAWRNAGWLGADRWILRTLGTPWRPGRVFER